MKGKERCDWSGNTEIYVHYHDEEWGVPIHDDLRIFEFLVLESAQAGLSWLTILKRREGYRLLYEDFDVGKVASFDEKRVQSMLQDARIIRNRKKIEASINNAQHFIEIAEEKGSFHDYLWGFNDGKQVVNRFDRQAQVPSTSPLSDRIAKDLKKRGFRFLGSTIIYAHMQATGMVNDHLTNCFRHQACMLAE